MKLLGNIYGHPIFIGEDVPERKQKMMERKLQSIYTEIMSVNGTRLYIKIGETIPEEEFKLKEIIWNYCDTRRKYQRMLGLNLFLILVIIFMSLA